MFPVRYFLTQSNVDLVQRLPDQPLDRERRGGLALASRRERQVQNYDKNVFIRCKNCRRTDVGAIDGHDVVGRQTPQA